MGFCHFHLILILLVFFAAEEKWPTRPITIYFGFAYFFFFCQAAYLAISSPFIQSIPIRLAMVT